MEAIDRFGRDWAKIVAHIGTRTVAQVRRLRLMASLSEAAQLRASSWSAYHNQLKREGGSVLTSTRVAGLSMCDRGSKEDAPHEAQASLAAQQGL